VTFGQSATTPVIRCTGDSYSAASPNSGTRRFAIDTGHFGRFYNCDCEESKRNSPYIHWKAVDRCETRRTSWAVFCHDLDEVKARVRAGRCCPACWPNWLCPDCGGDRGNACGVGTNQGLILATLPPEWRGGRKSGLPEGDATDPDAAPPARPGTLPVSGPEPPVGAPADSAAPALEPEETSSGPLASQAGPRIVRSVGLHGLQHRKDAATRR
jgi:hypothetical protein